MARLGSKVTRSELSTIQKNTFSDGILWWNRSHTSFLGLIGYMVRSGAKLLRTKTLLNFASKALSNSFFQKTRFRFEFLYEIAPHLFSWPNGLECTMGSKVTRSELSSIQKNTFSDGILWWNRSHTSFLGLIGYMVHSGVNYFSERNLCSILPQKPSQIRFFKKHIFGLNFCAKSHHT